MPESVRAAMTACVDREAATGCYETEESLDDLLQCEVYQRLARVLGAPAGDIALFDSATRAWCAVVPRLRPGPADRIWITPYEYAGNLIALFSLRDRTGCRIEVIPTLPGGDLDLEWMSRHIRDDVAFVSVTHIPSGCGIVNPVEEIGRLLAPYRCFYAVDACQSVGQIPVDAARIGCQLLTGAGRKFLRGRGAPASPMWRLPYARSWLPDSTTCTSRTSTRPPDTVSPTTAPAAWNSRSVRARRWSG